MVVLLSIAFMGGFTYALTQLGSQQLPSFAVSTPNPFVFCQNLSPGQSVTSGIVVYSCTNPADAFQVTFSASPTPTFNVTNTGFDSLSIQFNGAPTFTGHDGCTGPNVTQLTSGVPVALNPGYYVYCASYTGPQSFTPVAITWSM